METETNLIFKQLTADTSTFHNRIISHHRVIPDIHMNVHEGHDPCKIALPQSHYSIRFHHILFGLATEADARTFPLRTPYNFCSILSDGHSVPLSNEFQPLAL